MGTYANEPPLVNKDFKLEAADSADYSRWFAFELLQNADDEMPNSSDELREIRFELRGDCLFVANTGRPFEASGLDGEHHVDVDKQASGEWELTLVEDL